MAHKMKIEVWSDVMCPFCYIGKKRLDDVLAEFGDRDRIELEYKSFELMPGLQTHPIRSSSQMLAEVKGMPLDQVEQMNAQIEQMAHAEGLAMDQGTAIPANTVNAHRLTHLAKESGRQVAATQALFLAHFAQGRNIDDLDELVAIGEEIGLEGAQVRETLESEAYTEEVQRDVTEGRQLGVQGVPFFVFDRKYAISGAQEAAVFESTIEKSFGEWAEANPASPFEVIEGQTCSVDGTCN